VAIWWYNRLCVPGVDLKAFDEQYFRRLQDYYRSIGRELWVLDVTTDLQIPSFVALSRRTDRPREDIILGFGAHFDVRLGVLRALTEMNQILPTVVGIRDDEAGRPVHPDRLAMQWWTQATVSNQRYLLPDDGALRSPNDYPSDFHTNLLDDISNCCDIIRAKDMELLVLDQTRPDIGLPVVKVIVPGLRHYWPRFGPGRLYDVPVEVGLLPRVLSEDQLNPFPLFF